MYLGRTAGMWCRTLFLLGLMPALSPAVRINANVREVMYLAKGQSVKLDCPFQLEPQDQGPESLDIEWTQMNSDRTNLDNVILSYHDHKLIHPSYHYVQQGLGIQQQGHLSQPLAQQNSGRENPAGHPLAPLADCCSGLQERVNFALADPSQSDASIYLQNVQISDSATYECKVKKNTLASRKVTILVLEKPSVPKCSIRGKVALGRDVALCCVSEASNSPLVYQWTKDHLQGNTMSAIATNGLRPGEVVIKNLSREHAGLYQCSVANKVGHAQCVLEIALADDSKQWSTLVGIGLGSVLLLILLLCLLVGLICCFRRRRHAKDTSRIRVSSQEGGSEASPRSVLGFLSNRISFTQRRKYEPPKEQDALEIICSTHDLSSPTASSSQESEIQSAGATVVTTKARVHYAPVLPSYMHSKSRAPASLPSPAVPSVRGPDSPSFERDAAKRKCHPSRQYGDVPVIASARSREDLVV